MRKLGVALVGLVLVAAACGGGDTGGTTEDDEASAGPQTRTILVDSSPKGVTAAVNQFFPNEVEVRPGDTVDFKLVWTGEPHSVTFGTLVDQVMPKVQGAGPEATFAPDVEKAFDALPVMLPEGPGDANQVAANPCYVETGALPTDAKKVCANKTQPAAFTGTYAYYSSGFLAPDTTYSVKLGDDLKPGDYWFYCNLHGSGMSGYLEVKAKDATIPSQDDVDKAAAAQLAKAADAEFTKGVEAAKAGKAPFPGNLAGFATGPTSPGVNEFIPATINAKVNEKVTWTIVGPHTITFNPTTAAEPMVKAPDGTWHLNEKGLAPAGGPGQPPPAFEGPPPAGPPVPKEVNGGKWNGTGTRSSGLFLSFPGSPTFNSYSLTFTKAGSYPYVCIVHPKMTGTVTVT